MRSVHLERDIEDPESSLGYILTPAAEQALERIRASFQPSSTQRAWRVTGDYGSGKTDFGLVLARSAMGEIKELPKPLHQFTPADKFLPTVVTGESEPLGVTVLRALDPKLEGLKERPTTGTVLKAVREAVTKAKRKRFAGLLLILDELGKNLEYAARNPEADDIFLLQRLAEEAARSADTPFVIVVMLHQGVAHYAAGLESAGRREWDKVAGRFEEIIYAQPLEQAATLVAATLNIDTDRLPKAIRRESESSMATAIEAGIYGTSTVLSAANLGPQIFPLHPSVLPVLSRTMRRFGQNERSLFSFISSAEPMGLQQYASRSVETADHYRIHHLFDYVRINLLPTVTSGSASTHWGIIDSVLASTPVHTTAEEEVLKTVAMLSLLDAPDLPATEEILLQAVSGDRKSTTAAIKALRDQGTLYERGSVKGFCLWPHTSVNLEEAFSEALEATRGHKDNVSLLCDSVQSAPLVPRKYYAETGTLRYAEVQLIPVSILQELLSNQPELDGRGPDLNLQVVLPTNETHRQSVVKLLRERTGQLTDGLIIAVGEPPDKSIIALKDLVAWEWVRENTPQLSGDRYAREEVTRQISQAKRNLRAKLGGLDNLAVPNATYLRCFSNSIAKGKNLKPGRQLLAFLGDECQRIYTHTPKILNELINRRAPSSAAVGARTKLVEAMVTSPDQPYLGMDTTKRPPEMALYLSILQAGGFHIETNASGWGFHIPPPEKDSRKLLPALNRITQTLQRHGIDAMVPVPEVFTDLARPPFGIREGLLPFILSIYLATHHQRVAVYEDETFLNEVGGDEFLRLMKQPQFFHLQYCEIEGVRAEVLTKLLEILRLNARDASNTDLIDLVRPLVVFISQEVPESSRKTNNLPAEAVAVRRALLDAKEPIKLIFTTLPEACGLPKIETEGLQSPELFASRLQTALHQIRTAYPNLINRLDAALCTAFDVSTEMPQGRSIVAGRANQLAAAVTEPTLKAFALRLGDGVLEDRAWIESVANFLARKSPERWTDQDEIEFHHQLEISVARFKRTELALIGTTHLLNGHACRIALTRSDGTEVGDLINWDGIDEKRIQPIEDKIEQILASHGRDGLAAAMRAIWRQLESQNTSE